jgi:hypothetical protein
MDLVYEDNNTSRWLTNLAYFYVVLMTIFSTLWFPSNTYVPPLMWYQFYPVSMMIGFYISAVWNKGNSAYPFLLLLQMIFSLVGFGANLAYVIITGLIIGRVGIDDLYDGDYSYLTSLDSRYFQITPDSTTGSNKTWLIAQMSLGAMNFAIICLASFVISISEMYKLEPDISLMCNNHCCGVRNRYDTTRKFTQSVSVLVFLWGAVLSVLTFVYFGDLVMPIAAFQNQHCWFLMMISMTLFPPIPYNDKPTKEEGDGLLSEESELAAAKEGKKLDEKTSLCIMGFVTSLIITIYTISAEVSFKQLNSLSSGCGTASEYESRLNGSIEWVYFKVNSITPALQTVNYTWVGSSLPNSHGWTCFNFITNILVVIFHLLIVFILLPISIGFIEDPVIRDKIAAIKAKREQEEAEKANTAYNKIKLTSLTSRYRSMDKKVYYAEDLQDKLYIPVGRPSRRLKS